MLHASRTNLVNAFNDGPHGGVAGPIDCFAVVGGAPAGRVDVDFVGFVAHRVRLNQVSHVRLVQHPQTYVITRNIVKIRTGVILRVFCF